MTRQQWIIIGILGILVLLVYCLGIIFVVPSLLNPSPQPTSVAVAVTATLGPTGTPASTKSATPATTNTLVNQAPPPPPPTFTHLPRGANPLFDAWSKADAATAYRFEFDMTVKGNLTGLSGTSTPNQEMSFFNLSGATSGKDSQLVMKGLLSAFLGGDPAKGFETMNVAGKTYIRGPLPLLGATENKWYIADSQTQANLFQNEKMLGNASTQNINWSAFKKTAAETLDSRKCDVYTGDRATTLEMFSTLSPQNTLDTNSLGQLDVAEIKFWICDDGYLHQMFINLEGKDKTQPTQTIAFRIRMHLYDFNNAGIKITPPANPAPLQAPGFFGIVTSTPTPKR